MTKSTLFDRLNQELEAFGKKAQAALDEGKLQIELLRFRRRLDGTARDLGLLVHRRERGGRDRPTSLRRAHAADRRPSGGRGSPGKADRGGAPGEGLGSAAGPGGVATAETAETPGAV